MLRKRTQAQRDAINARAAAYPKPLSPTQLQALKSIARAPVKYIGGGWESYADTWEGYADKTINSLVGRRLCRIEGKQRPRAIITAAGKRELARHRGSHAN